MAPAESSPANRIEALLQQLGLERVHVAACMSGDWGELVTKHADCIHSLTVVAPHLNKGIPDGLNTFQSPAMVIAGDQGAPAQRARELAARFGNGELFELSDYSSPMWADTIADRTTNVAEALCDFLARAEFERSLSTVPLPQGEGEIAGIYYRIRGTGSPLVLLPLSMAPSQWEPLVSRISDRYCTITLSGPHLGAISLLEARGSSGYGDLVAQVVDQAKLTSGETILEVGCGSGVLARALAKRTDHRNPIVATDINQYLLSEARALAAKDGLGETITFEEANAETLSFPDAHFDVAISCTVLEEGQADRMLSELARITKSEGRVVVMTRAIDVQWWVNLPVPDELRSKLNGLGPSTGAGVGDDGCADASLYPRFLRAGLTPLMMGPQFAIYKEGERLNGVLDRLLALLPESDARTCRDAARQAKTDGTVFVGEPFHCAVGVKSDRAT
ncbi:MAG: methyltransferase domain-containing protein [Gemmatimonadetes bacterium]|nr:methyltransferase domain-containing protein [Gemmatimonadota bacterium]